MRVHVTIDQVALRRVQDRLQGRLDRAQALRPAFDAVADDFLQMQRSRFAGGAGWAPLSPAYAVRKAMTGRGTRPLAGGALEASMTRRGARYSVRRITSKSMFMGTRNPVANLHNAGTRRMPKRPLITVRGSDRERWGDLFAEHLRGGGPRRLGL